MAKKTVKKEDFDLGETMPSDGMNYAFEIKIPKERVAVLIGKSGETKKELEGFTDCKMDIDSKEGDVRISGGDSIKMYALREVVKAIGRGFNPEIARLLLKQDYALEIVNLLDYVKNKDHFERLKGRVIGAEGKSRQTIEGLTGTFISVYGKTISIIGDSEGVVTSKKAIESLLQGSPHSNVYRWLEKSRRATKEKRAKDW
ncbi:MAG: KH domain-containing protein [Candidatus Woesearchaeota archaeon]|jgi:ribosomal RNA assembly protein